MALIWAEFTESPSLKQYVNLKAHAERIGQWELWREKALEYLRERIGRAKSESQKDRWAWYRKADHSELVRIFLWEKDVEAAWREAKRAAAQMTSGWSLPLSGIRIIPKMRCRPTSAKSSPHWTGRITKRTRRPSVSCEKCES